MSIGEFARLSRLSAKALRLYDELGLLPPARVDLDSGYRWYAAGQLDNAPLVASLRQIGVPLAQIQLILSLELLRHAGNQQEVWDLGKEVIAMLKAQPPPPAHQEAYIHVDQDMLTAAQWQAVSDSAMAWVAEQQRQPSDLGLRIAVLATTSPVTGDPDTEGYVDASG